MDNQTTPQTNQTPDPSAAPATDNTSSPQIKSPSNPASPAKHRLGKGKLAALLVVCVFILTSGVFAWHYYTSKVAIPTATSTTSTPDKSVLKVGTIIDEDGVEADRKEFTPFINYMVSQLHDQGITKGSFVPDTSVSNMAKLLREGKVDIYIDSIFPVFVADRLSGSQMIANRWKEGVEKYHTAVFVKTSSTIKTTDDLKGKMLAFDSPTSTVGYFLPKAELIKLGYTLTEKQKTTDPVAANEIGYTFVHGDVFDDVQNGVTPAGAESEQEIRDHFGATFDQQYRIVTTTPDVLRFLVTGRQDMAPSLRSAIKASLLSMDKSTAGQTTLKLFSGTAKFTDVGSDNDAAYGEIQNLTDLIEKEIVQGGVGATQTN